MAKIKRCSQEHLLIKECSVKRPGLLSQENEPGMSHGEQMEADSLKDRLLELILEDLRETVHLSPPTCAAYTLHDTI